MIPRAHIMEWRSAGHPWRSDAMVEQDLIISTMLVMLFEDRELRSTFLFRGGTALHKLYLEQPHRYSEDIDLVQRRAGAIGPQFDRIREVLQDRFGNPRRTIGPDVATLVYRVDSEDSPPVQLRIKVEINTREHRPVLPTEYRRLEVRSRWFVGGADVPAYQADELLATKLRALYQRRKGRDLLDLGLALRNLPVNGRQLCEVFRIYMEAHGHTVSAAVFRANLEAKLRHQGFLTDCIPLVRPGSATDPQADYELLDRMVLRFLDTARGT